MILARVQFLPIAVNGRRWPTRAQGTCGLGGVV